MAALRALKLRLTPRAVRNLGQIADYLVARNPTAARRVMTALQDALELIALHPQAGRPQKQGLRRFTHPRYPYLIFYRIDEAEGAIEIITIRHGARAPLS